MEISETPLKKIIRPSFRIFLYLLIFIMVMVVLTLVNYKFCLQNPGGNDFAPRWLGTRFLFINGQSPYSEETTLAIQNLIYGHPAQPGEDQSLFVYPLFTVYLMTPFALISDYTMSRAVWMSTLEITLLAIGFLGLALSRWRPSTIMLVFLYVFMILWYHSLRPLINGNPSILVAFFIIAALYAVRSERDIMAGLLFALSTIKPQVVILLIPLVLFWSLTHKRWVLIGSIFFSLMLMVGTSIILLPDWINQNLDQIRAYPSYTFAGSPGEIITEWLPDTGLIISIGIAIVFILLLLWEWRSVPNAQFDKFLWLSYLTLTCTNLIGFRTAASNFIVLLPALLLVLAYWNETRFGYLLIFLSLLVLLIGLWWLFIVTLIPADQPTQHPIMFFPFPLFILMGLYSIRRKIYITVEIAVSGDEDNKFV